MSKSQAFFLLLSYIFIATIADGYHHKSKRVNKYYQDGQEEEETGEPSRYKFGVPKKYAKEYRRESPNDEYDNWQGRWMPSRPGDPTPPPKVLHIDGEFKNPNIMTDAHHGVGMGIQLYDCDNGRKNLGQDWDWSPVNYTCYENKITPSYSIDPLLYCEHIPSAYVPIHKCMSETIEYDDDIPIYGTHRPVWPAYGEYKFIPRQRWIHSLEHGAIVMLYHPCANPLEVKRLKKLVTGCLKRHIITPYTLLDEDRPLALVSWGCRLTMSYVNPSVVKHFIINKALRGREYISRDGAFSEYLIRSSKIVTDEDDTTLCPNM